MSSDADNWPLSRLLFKPFPRLGAALVCIAFLTPLWGRPVLALWQAWSN